MADSPQYRQSDRLLVVMPSWVGDVAMATPTLRALRRLYPAARITALVRASVRPMLDPCPWIDRFVTVRARKKGVNGLRRRGVLPLGRRLAAGKFDTAVLLPNSFRSALIARMAGIPRRVGYDRDGRGFLLTDRLLPRKQMGGWVPVPTRDYYLGLARYLGAVEIDATMQLFTRPEQDDTAATMLRKAGCEPGARPLVLLVPGASYGDAKMWSPARFAEVADWCVKEHGAAVAVSGAPKERSVVRAVVDAASQPIANLCEVGVDLGLLKSVIRTSSLVISNDTGPRHIAAAFGVPVVSLFGPTDPAWTRIDFALERQIQIPVECGPCQLKKCPLDHRCMKLIEPGMVCEKAAELLARVPASA